MRSQAEDALASSSAPASSPRTVLRRMAGSARALGRAGRLSEMPPEATLQSTAWRRPAARQLTRRAAGRGDASSGRSSSMSQKSLLRRYGVVFWRLLEREALAAAVARPLAGLPQVRGPRRSSPGWLRRRFSGEQFALTPSASSPIGARPAGACSYPCRAPIRYSASSRRARGSQRCRPIAWPTGRPRAGARIADQVPRDFLSRQRVGSAEGAPARAGRVPPISPTDLGDDPDHPADLGVAREAADDCGYTSSMRRKTKPCRLATRGSLRLEHWQKANRSRRGGPP